MLFLSLERQAGLFLTKISSAHGAGLNTAANATGLKYFGTATDNGNLDDAPYAEQLANTEDFGQITPGNSMKVRLGLFMSTATPIWERCSFL